MLNIRASQILAPHNLLAKKINSIVGADERRVRRIRPATQVFQNRTIRVDLNPRVRCSIEELPEAFTSLLNIWRAIVNRDLRYQQRLGNLPTFVGVRNLCVTSSVFMDETICYPSLRIFVDNTQVAAFIVSRWAIRTGILPRIYSVVEADNCYEDTFHKSNPFHIETLLRDSNVLSLRFGAAAEIHTRVYDDDFKRDTFPIAGFAISRPFGNRVSVYAMRHVYRSFVDTHLSDFIDNVLNHNNQFTRRWAFDRWVTQQVKRVHRSYYGVYKYSSRYLSARLNHQVVTKDKAMHIDTALLHNARACKTDAVFNRSCSILSQNFELLKRYFDSIKAERDNLRRMLRNADLVAPIVEVAHVEVNKLKLGQMKRRIKERAIAAFTMEQAFVVDHMQADEVAFAVHKLREIFPVEVNNGVATIQLRR